MEKSFDTIVIGAGPAGMGCAIELQKNDHYVCVIDKATFPRNKTCAGLVTNKTRELLKTLLDREDIDDLFCFTASTLKLYRKTQLLSETQIKNRAGLVNRIDFDNALVERYKSLGGTTLEGEKDVAIDYKNNCVTLANGDKINYKNLIFADGALSMAHKLFGVDKRKMAFGIEAYVPSYQIPTTSVDLYFDCIDNGYLWVFPHGDTVCVGVANLYNKKTDYIKIIKDFLSSVGVDPEKQRYTGAYLPYGYVVPQDKLPANAFLIGDAGGFTDPITGEGLYMSMKTGMLAAEAILTDKPKENYLNSVKPIASIVEEGKKVQNIFFSSMVQKVFLNKVKGKDDLVAYFYDNMVDDYRYDYRDIQKIYSDYKNK